MAYYGSYGSNYPMGSAPPPGGAAGAYNGYGGYGGYGGGQQYAQQSAYSNPSYGPQYGAPPMMGQMSMGPPMGGFGGGYQQAPTGMAPPMGRMFDQASAMQNMMCSQMMQMQNMHSLGMIEDDEEDMEAMRRAKARRRRRRMRMEEEEEEEAEREAEMAEQQALLAKQQEKLKALQDQLQDDEEKKEKLRCTYIENLEKQQKCTGAFDATQGTVEPIEYYDSEDAVAKWFESEKGVIIYRTDDDDEGDKSKGRWDSEYDVEYFRDAIKGWGTDEDAIIFVTCTRSNEQRNIIYLKYKTAYGRDLIDDIRGDTSGDFRDCLLGLFEKPALFDAYEIKKSIYGLGTDEATLIEIMFTRTNEQIKEMREQYNNITYEKRGKPELSLEEDIENDTSGDFKRLLISSSTANRNEKSHDEIVEAVEPVMYEDRFTGMFDIDKGKLCNLSRCKYMAKELMEAGEDMIGTDEETFNRIFSTQDFITLRIVYDEYVKLTQRDIMNSVDRETSGDYKKGLLAIIQSIKCRPMFFAQKLYKSMKGLGTNDDDLIRIIVSRSELDMVQIKQCFLEQYKQTLWNFIQDDTSGDYKKLLLGIVGKD